MKQNVEKQEIIKEIIINDFDTFNNIVQDYLPEITRDELLERYNNKDNIFVGYYSDNNLIGVCYGTTKSKDDIELSGIAVICPYNKQGRGSKLIKYFENVAKYRGYKKISLGSADGYVEHFYIKNGYTISSLKILTENDEWKKKKSNMYPISRVEMQGKYTKLVIENIDYESTNKQSLCEFYNGCDCFYIFEKTA